ncbi:DLG1 protein, partial [Chloroceryle aenea]|nr:DLG1 protein [Chloroceryle aenea]
VNSADTERAVGILTKYQSTLQSPEEQELKASIGKVSHIFQSELFQALLDIHEFYDFMLRSAPLKPSSLDTHHDTVRQQHGANKSNSAVTPRLPQNLPEDPSQDGKQRLPAGAADSALGMPPRLVRVTARRTEAPASICSLVLGSRSTLPQVSL